MLETKNLVKVYKPKKGVPVKALDDVSLRFPDKGMVFLLGKSGSGKSTLLNLIGGLDKYDGGEIIIKGVSSKAFKQKHFDSYRNTYVGFIFQEYNILDDFTVGANIALALELQGKKATNEVINGILKDVDLDGYGARRPNELSGGQKQRVAIARALVKNPKIIMADEPSGALDSVTGKQVFETLKKLSEEKLVIVVSHDRDFATRYGDRIIELADGKVISDTTVCHDESENISGVTFEGTTAKVSAGYCLTEEDRIAINEYIQKVRNGVDIEFADANRKKFLPTETDKIQSIDDSPFALIKSKLALRHAFKIGGSGLKHKKFRLVMTIFLSCIAFILFGLVDTFSSYNHIRTCTNSLHDSDVRYASVSKQVLVEDGDYSYWSGYGVGFSENEIQKLSEETGVSFKPVLTNGQYDRYDFSANVGDEKSGENDYFGLRPTDFSGAVEITQNDLETMGYSLVAGKLPEGKKNEIAISLFVCETFIKRGYVNGEDKSSIRTPADMVGKTLVIKSKEYTVAGVVDTKIDTARYNSLFNIDENQDAAGQILDYVLMTEFNSAVENNFTGMMLVGEGTLAIMIEEMRATVTADRCELNFHGSDDVSYFTPYSATNLENVNRDRIVWFGGERKTLGKNEILISSHAAENYFGAVYHDEFGEFHFDETLLAIENMHFRYFNYYSHYDYSDAVKREDIKIVGIIDYHTYVEGDEKLIGGVPDAVLPDDLFDLIVEDQYGGDDRYQFALGAMPDGRGEIENFVTYCYTEKDGVRYTLNNPVCFELDGLDEMIKVLANVFVWVGLVFAVFASLLLSNFIATSISYKKQEIGILRAIGSRGNDVFRIFFAESFIIAMINFALSCVGTGLITFFINMSVRNEVGILITFLNFGIRQVLVLFVISVAVAAIASFFPVKRIASKRPIDAIRGR